MQAFKEWAAEIGPLSEDVKTSVKAVVMMRPDMPADRLIPALLLAAFDLHKLQCEHYNIDPDDQLVNFKRQCDLTPLVAKERAKGLVATTDDPPRA